MRYLSASALFLLCLAGCSGGKPADAIVRVGNRYITSGELERKMDGVSSEYQKYLSTPSGKKQFLEILIREKIILSAAEGGGLAKSETYKKEIKRMQAEMSARLDEYRDFLLTRLLIDKLKEDGVIAVSKSEIAEYYNKYPYEYSISHILLADPEDAESLLKKLKSGASFAAAAKEKSLDNETAQDGGKVAPFIVGQFLPELENAAIKMRDGELQGIFKSRFGYHILRRNSKTEPGLAEASERIGKILEKKKFDAYLESMQNKYKVEVLDENYRYN